MGSWKFSTLKSIRIIAFIDLVSFIVIFRFRWFPFSCIHDSWVQFLISFSLCMYYVRGLYFIDDDIGHKTNSFGDCLFCTKKNSLSKAYYRTFTKLLGVILLFLFMLYWSSQHVNPHFFFVSDRGRDICSISGYLPLHPTRKNSHKKWQRTDWNKHSH